MRRTPPTDEERARLTAALEQVDALAADLQAVLSDGWPSPEVLAERDAPLLDDWRRADTLVRNLRGTVTGHPHLDGEIATSPLHAICERVGVARTESRWYRLGEPRKFGGIL